MSVRTIVAEPDFEVKHLVANFRGSMNLIINNVYYLARKENITMKLKKWFEDLDWWLCIYLKPWWLRLYLHRLWVRAEEFHPSLDLDADIVYAIAMRFGNGHLDSKPVIEYDMELMRRRNIAHNRMAEKTKISQASI